jgi:ubiquinone biosynthesis protein COQ4
MSSLIRAIREVRIFQALLQLIRNPARTERVFDLSDLGTLQAGPDAIRAVVDGAMSDPRFVEQFEARFMPEPLRPERFKDFAPGTLGRAYYEHMTGSGLSPDFYPEIQMVKPEHYIAMRARHDHDIWHVVAGFDTSVEGEIGVQAFMLGQFPSGISLALMAAGFLHFARYRPNGVPELMNCVYEGYGRGKRMRPLLSENWETHWNKQLVDLREELCA